VNTFGEQVQAAIGAHGMWKARLRQAIDTGSSDFKVDVVRQDNQCAFGKWLYGEGKGGFPSMADYEQARRLHAEFHGEAAKVLAHAVSGRPKEAHDAMQPGAPFVHVSSALVGTLMRLQRAAA